MKKHDQIYTGAQNKKAGYDISIPENFNGSVIYFIHGYKGYKNWGCWDLISDYFYDKGFAFAKCNLSHNGTTIENPNAFDDLDSFGQNRYSYELIDIENFISQVNTHFQPKTIHKRILIGHSRGGGDSILSVTESNNIDMLITWASICDIESRFLTGPLFEEWQKTGVFSVRNGRTLQDMPHYFSFYEDFIENKETLNIQKKAREISIPWAIIHGTNDTSVKPNEAETLKKYSKQAELIWIENANHVFGSKEPYDSLSLPKDSIILVEKTLEFIKRNV